MTYNEVVYERANDGKLRRKNWAITIGEWIVKIVTFPMTVLGTIAVTLFKGNQVPFAVAGLIFAIYLNLNSYWVQFFDYPSISPVPGFFESYLSVQDVLYLPFNIGAPNDFVAFWVSFLFSGVATVLQSMAISSSGTHEELTARYKHYKELSCPPADIDYGKHVRMTQVAAKQVRDIDTKEHYGSVGLTTISWIIEISLTLSGMSGIRGLMWIAAFVYSVIVSIAPELLVTRVQYLIAQQKMRQARREAQRAEAQRGGA